MDKETSRLLQEEMERKKKERIKEVFIKCTSTKLKTAFIFALARFEETFGHLWDESCQDEVESPEYYKNLYLSLRKSVLDNGNNQIRNFEKEMENYEVSLRTQIFKVKEYEQK